jgi:site-specific recombinase XerD
MHLNDAITTYLDHRRRQRRSPDTIRLYQQQLTTWQQWRETHDHAPILHSISIDELRAFFAYLSETPPHRGSRQQHSGLAGRTVRSYYRTLRGFWGWLSFEEDTHGETLLLPRQLRYFHNNRIPLPAIDERERPALTREQLDQLLTAANNGHDEASARDRAILLLLWESGMRIHELAGLTDACIDLDRQQARIIGKGNKQGVVFWGKATRFALEDYLRQRRGDPGGPLLRGVSWRNNGEALTPNLIRCLIKRLAKHANINLPTGSPCHCFRHGFARELRRRGLSREEVGELLRHDDPATTQIYLGLDEEPLRTAHRRAFP